VTEPLASIRSVTPADSARAVATTEITLVGGARLIAKGEIQQVESRIVGAARGSIMELAWMTDAETGQPVGINPEHVTMIRAHAGEARHP
jgi:uncharacterized protein YlzI (FlbEa/FlbD family)